MCLCCLLCKGNLPGNLRPLEGWFNKLPSIHRLKRGGWWGAQKPSCGWEKCQGGAGTLELAALGAGQGKEQVAPSHQPLLSSAGILHSVLPLTSSGTCDSLCSGESLKARCARRSSLLLKWPGGSAPRGPAGSSSPLLGWLKLGWQELSPVEGG